MNTPTYMRTNGMHVCIFVISDCVHVRLCSCTGYYTSTESAVYAILISICYDHKFRIINHNLTIEIKS